jgi:hypothetical protein
MLLKTAQPFQSIAGLVYSKAAILEKDQETLPDCLIVIDYENRSL